MNIDLKELVEEDFLGLSLERVGNLLYPVVNGRRENTPIRSVRETANESNCPVNFPILEKPKEEEDDDDDDDDDDISEENQQCGNTRVLRTNRWAELNEKQNEALKIARQGKNVFITGPAGTGKSHLIQSIKYMLRSKYPKEGEWVALGSTGTSAAALGGQSLHSFAGCGVPNHKKDFEKAWRDDKRDAWRTIRVMIIDEISMINGEFLDNLSQVICKIRGGNDKPFGGIQLIFCGDFLQLPPITKRQYQRMPTMQRNQMHCDRGFAFESAVWRDAEFKTVVLAEVFRQENREFIDILHNFRKGVVTNEAERFLERCQRSLPIKEGVKPTILYARNVDVSRENLKELAKLPGEQHVYEAFDTIKVSLNPESNIAEDRAESMLYSNPFFDHCIAEEKLLLKEGAQVMLIKNHDIKGGLVNGSRGKVVGFTDKLPETNVIMDPWSPYEIPGQNGKTIYPVVKFVGRDEPMTVMPLPFRSTIAGVGDSIRVAIPLKLAWAVTVHKSQGMTLNYVKVDLRGVFSEAQAYVALSRASDENGLELRNFSRRVVRADKRALDFYENPDAKFRLWSETAAVISPNKECAALSVPRPISGCLSGLAFVFTGELKSCQREEANKLVKACGGDIRSAVSGKTNYLVIGNVLDDGRDVKSSNKYCKAKEIMGGVNTSNLKIVDEEQFYALITSRRRKRPAVVSATFFAPTKKGSSYEDPIVL